MLLNIIAFLEFFVFLYYGVAEDGGDIDIGRSPEESHDDLIARRGLESGFTQPLSQVIARGFEMALDLRFGALDHPGDRGDWHPLDVVERECSTPNARQCSQRAVDVTLQLSTLQDLLRRRRRHVRNDVFQFLVF